MKGLRIVFMGTPDFAVPALRALYESDHEIVCVYSQPPRPKGRGHKVQPSPVHEYAESKNIPVFNPLNFKTPESIEEFKANNADVTIVAAYGLILPQAVLEAPKYGCLNIHASLLPRWRGASPIQRAILEGDSETGVTIMQMDKGLDTGDMLTKKTVPITPQTTASSLHDQLAALGGPMVLDVLNSIENLNPEKQDDTKTIYAPLLKKEDGVINWNKTAIEIDRQIRALNPWPGTKSSTFKITAAALTDKTTKEKPGTILDKNGLVACGENTVLQIKMLQPEGGKSMDFTSAINGKYIQVGDIFS